MTSEPEVTLTSPASLRSQIKARPDFNFLYSRTPLSVTLDPRVTHADRTLYDIIGFLGWPANECHESTRELADAGATDQKQACRSISRLISGGHLIRNKGGALVLTSPIFLAKENRRASRSSLGCKACGSAKPLKNGICIACRRQDSADDEVRGFMKGSPGAPYEIVFLGLKANGSKCNAKELKRAFKRVTDPPRRAKIAI